MTQQELAAREKYENKVRKSMRKTGFYGRGSKRGRGQGTRVMHIRGSFPAGR